jgi:polyphosphate kinase
MTDFDKSKQGNPKDSSLTPNATRAGVSSRSYFYSKFRAIPDKRKPMLTYYGKDYFQNYEFSWLQFNWRVLQEALDQRNPLMERVRFIGIVCANLDEFFQKRVGGLKRQFLGGIDHLPIDGMTPKAQLEMIRDEVKNMIGQTRNCFLNNLVPLLSDNGIEILLYDQLDHAQRNRVDAYFEKQLFPILTPLAVDHAHPFPLISNKTRSLAVELVDPRFPDEILFARVKIPHNRPRWYCLEQTELTTSLVLMDDIIRHHITRLFPGMRILSANIFRVTRNADVELNDEEAEDLLELISDEVRGRRFANIVRLEIESKTPMRVKELLIDKMEITWQDVFEVDGAVGLADALEIANMPGYDHLRYKPWIPVNHPLLTSPGDGPFQDMFSIIRRGDFLVHHPYHSFQTSVEQFVFQAANDPNVLAIKQTLYRTSSDSAVMNALIKAADLGKQVAVLVELKARFDEERNIEWAQKLEKAGVHVAYGLPGLKIHSKLTVIVREETEGIRRYAHIGTGNYNPKTAKLYEDLGLFTCNEEITNDVTALFNFLTGYAPDQTYNQLLVAPHFLREKVIALIDFEIEQAKVGKPASIIAKMNSLEDPEIIQKLYEASQAGVEIDLFVRGVCRLYPGKFGISERIRVHSIIGRFLEHSRIYHFHHSGEHLYYIGSADWMHRNLDARVEVLTPIHDMGIKSYLRYLLALLLSDNRQRWVLQTDGFYHRVLYDSQNDEVSTQNRLMEHTKNMDEPIPQATVFNP